MNLKKEFQEYKRIYDHYFDNFKSINKEIEEEVTFILEQDKKDLEASHESKDKTEALERNLFRQFKVGVIHQDMSKIGERLLYIKESAVRNSVDLELSDTEKTFLENLSNNSALAYMIDSNGTLTSKTAMLDEAIKKKVAEDTQMKYGYLEALRKSPQNGK